MPCRGGGGAAGGGKVDGVLRKEEVGVGVRECIWKKKRRGKVHVSKSSTTTTALVVDRCGQKGLMLASYG